MVRSSRHFFSRVLSMTVAATIVVALLPPLSALQGRAAAATATRTPSRTDAVSASRSDSPSIEQTGTFDTTSNTPSDTHSASNERSRSRTYSMSWSASMSRTLSLPTRSPSFGSATQNASDTFSYSPTQQESVSFDTRSITEEWTRSASRSGPTPSTTFTVTAWRSTSATSTVSTSRSFSEEPTHASPSPSESFTRSDSMPKSSTSTGSPSQTGSSELSSSDSESPSQTPEETLSSTNISTETPTLSTTSTPTSTYASASEGQSQSYSLTRSPTTTETLSPTQQLSVSWESSSRSISFSPSASSSQSEAPSLSRTPSDSPQRGRAVSSTLDSSNSPLVNTTNTSTETLGTPSQYRSASASPSTSWTISASDEPSHTHSDATPSHSASSAVSPSLTPLDTRTPSLMPSPTVTGSPSMSASSSTSASNSISRNSPSMSWHQSKSLSFSDNHTPSLTDVGESDTLEVPRTLSRSQSLTFAVSHSSTMTEGGTVSQSRNSHSSSKSVSVEPTAAESVSETPSPTPSGASPTPNTTVSGETPTVTMSGMTPTRNRRSSRSNTTSVSATQEAASVTSSASSAHSLTGSISHSISMPPTASRSATESYGTPTLPRTNHTFSLSDSDGGSHSIATDTATTSHSPSSEASETLTNTPSPSTSRSGTVTLSVSVDGSRSPTTTVSRSPSASETITQQSSVTVDTPSPSKETSATTTPTVVGTDTLHHRLSATKQPSVSHTRRSPSASPSSAPSWSVSTSLTGDPTSSTTRSTDGGSATRSDSGTEAMTETHTSTRIRTVSRKPSSSQSTSDSMSLGTITAEATLERTASATMGSGTRTKYSKTASPKTNTKTRTTTATEPQSETPSATASFLPSVSFTAPSPSSAASASNTASRRTPTQSATPSESSTASLSGSQTNSNEFSSSPSASPTNEFSSSPSLSPSGSSSSSESFTAAASATKLSPSPSASASPLHSLSPTATPSSQSSSSNSVSSTSSSTLSTSFTVSRSLTTDRSSTPSASPSSSDDRTESETMPASPTHETSKTTTHSEEITSSSSDSKTVSPSNERSPSQSNSASHSGSASPTEDRKTSSRSSTENWSASRSLTAPPSRTVIRTPSQSVYATDTRTLRRSETASGSPSVTAVVTNTVVSESPQSTRSSSNSHFSKTGSATSLMSSTETLLFTASPSATTDATIEGSLSPSRSTTGGSRSFPLPITETKTPSADVSASLQSMTTTNSLSEQGSRTKTTSPSNTMRTPTFTQTLLLTEEVTRSETLALTGTRDYRRSRSRSLVDTVTDTVTEVESVTSTLSGVPTVTPSLSRTLEATRSGARPSASNTSTEDESSTTSITFARTGTESITASSSTTANITVTAPLSRTHEPTAEGSQSRSGSETISVEWTASLSPSASASSTASSSCSSSTDATSTVSVKPTDATHHVTGTRKTESASASHSPDASSTWTLQQSLSPSPSSDLTLTETNSVSVTVGTRSTTKSVSSMRSASASKTRSVMSFATSSASIENPTRTQVREMFTVVIANAPATYSASLDVAYVVLYNGVESVSNNSCAQRVQSLAHNASSRQLVFLSANRSLNTQVLSLYFTGVVAAIGRYDLCHYSATRREWTWWNLNLLLRPKYRPSQYVLPKGRLVVNASFRLTIGVYGATALDHMALVLRSTMSTANGTLSCPMTAPSQQGTINGAFWLSAGPAATNNSFSASGNVLASGDYAVCYYGFPYVDYRLALAFVRVIGAPMALLSTDVASVATAFQTFRVTVVGVGLSTIDAFLIANGSDCTATRVPPSLVHRRVQTSFSPMASLAAVVSDVLVAYPVDNATLCVKSNVSNYYEAMRTIRVLDNAALGMRPNATVDGNGTAPLAYAETSVVAVQSVTPAVNGTLTPDRDTLLLCYGNHTTCHCVDDPLIPKQWFTTSSSSAVWTLPSVSRRTAPHDAPVLSEVWSVCYITNATRPWRVPPLQQLIVHRYPTEPQILPYVSVQTSIDVVVQSFNHTGANTIVRVFGSGLSTHGCGAASALPTSAVTLATRNATVNGIERVVATVTPHLVQPMELCIYHTPTNATTVSSTLRVVPTAPESFHPTRFVANVSTPVSFTPTDGSVFNFATTSATVVMCPNNTATSAIRLVVDAVLNGTALRLRFTNITQRGMVIAAGALCFFNPTNGSYIPIPQGGNTFAVTSQLTFSAFPTTGALRNVAPVVPTASATSSFVTISIRGVSMYAGDASLATCSSNPSVTFAMVSSVTTAVTTTTALTGTTTYDVVTQVWRAYSSVSGNFTLCIAHGAATTPTPLREGNTTLSTSAPTTLVFDSSMSSTQQLPTIPHAVLLNHANDYWLVAPTTVDSGAKFSAVRLVQYLSSLDDVCSNPIATSLVLSTVAATTTSELVWRYNTSVKSFVRGNVTICYQSYSSKWYPFGNGAVQPFFMQGAPLPSTLQVSDAQTSTVNQALATCSANVLFSGYQLDASIDQFFYYYTASATATVATEVCRSSGTPLTITSVVRDTTDLNRLVNITARVVPSLLGSIAICASLGSSDRASPAVPPSLLGIVAVSNPLNITLLASSSSLTFSSSRQTLIASRCISANVLAAPSPVRYNYSIRFVDASHFLPLDDPVATQSFAMLNTPHVSYMVRLSAFVLASGAALMSMDSAWIAPTSAPTTDTAKLLYCSFFNASFNGVTSASTNRFVFATHVVLMKNYVTTGCGVFLVDGTLGREHSAVLSAETAQRLLQVQPTLNWDGAFLFPLLTLVYTTSLQVAVSSGYTVDEATDAFASLLAITNPLDEVARGLQNATEVVANHLSMLSSVATFVSGAGGATGAVGLAPLVVARSQLLGSILCNRTASGTTLSMTAGAASLSAQQPETLSSAAAFAIGSRIRIVVPRAVGSNVGTSNCVTAIALPNFIADGTAAAAATGSIGFRAQRRHMEAASIGSLLGFNLSTVMVFSDAPITTAFLALDNSSYARVDALHGYRFYGANRSSATLASTAGGTWDALPASWTPYTYGTDGSNGRTLAINITASASNVARYLVFSGLAEAIYPDVILLKREVATKAVNESIYWALLSIVSAHVVLVLAAVVYDRYASAKRYRQTKELLFGIPTPPPRWLQLHRYLCMATENPISLTAEEYLKVRNESAGAGPQVRSVNQELTMHPLAVLATPSKVHTIAMYWYCLILATVFVNRESIASQVPFLWDDSVLLGGMAALLARPFATWTRVAQLRQAQDTPSLWSASTAILVAVIAGAASSAETLSIVVSMLVLGVAAHAIALVVLHVRGAGPTPAVVTARQQTTTAQHVSRVWSLHHLIQVPMLTQVVGALTLLVACVLSIVLLFFVPYFTSKNPIFAYRPATSTRTSEAEFPYFGRGDPYRLAAPSAYTPDTTIAWKTFVLGLVLDATIVEVFVCLASVMWTRAISWWRVTRHLGPTSGQRVLRMGGGIGNHPNVPTAAASRQPYAPDEVEDDDAHFVDVFSGSPVNSVYPTEDFYKKESNPVTPSPFARSPGEYPSHTNSFRGSARKATTSFWPNRTHGGLIEEVTDVASLDDDDMFASIDPNDDRGDGGRHSRASHSRADSFANYRPDDDVEDYMDHAPSVQRQLRVPSRSRRVAGPDAAIEPVDNPFGTDEVWRYPTNASAQSQGRVSTALRGRRGWSGSNLRLDAMRGDDSDMMIEEGGAASFSGRHRSGGMSLSRSGEGEEIVFDDPWETSEAASTGHSMRRR